jgi:Glycosyl transferase family group 2
MNFAMNLTYNVERRLSQIDRREGWTHGDESEAYKEILEQVVKEDGRAWAAGDIRMGDIILIIDSDTRIPKDCLLDAATEFHESPEVAILQHKSSFIQVGHNYWETWIIQLTQLIYASITYSVASGNTGPFLGYLFHFHCIESLILGTTHLFVGQHCKRWHGLKTNKRNGGQNLMY